MGDEGPTARREKAPRPHDSESPANESEDDLADPTDQAQSSTTPEEDTGYPALVWMARLDRVRRFLPRSLYLGVSARLGARFRDEYHRRNLDAKENARGSPPADERIAWHAVWIAEAFLPSTVDALETGIERLGWWEQHRDESIAEHIAAFRSGRGGGTLYLPPLRRETKGSAHAFLSGQKVRGNLPEGVEFITGQVRGVTPSLTVLVAGFRFDASVSTAVDQALRRRYRTYHEMVSWTGSRQMTPDLQRRDAIRALERAQVDACRAWLAEHLPGYFARGDAGSKPPATLLLTTQKVEPFLRSEESAFWAHEAGIEFAFERWETGIDGLRYAFRPREDGVAVLAGRESDIFAKPEDWRKYGHHDNVWSLTTEIDHNLMPLMAFRTADAIVYDGRRRLGRLRDSLSSLAKGPTRRQLQAVQAQLGTMGSDLAALTADMLSWPDRRPRVLRDIPEINAIDDSSRANARNTTDEKPLKARLLDWYVEQAREVRGFEVATRELLVATAQIAGASESIRLQRVVTWATLAALGVSMAAFLISVVGGPWDALSATPIPVTTPLP